MREIIWSPESLEDYENNIIFLVEEWTEREAQVFIDEVQELLYYLKSGNVEFKLIGYKDIRGVKVCDQINLLYRIKKDNDIELLRFWGDKQNPKKLKEALEEYFTK